MSTYQTIPEDVHTGESVTRLGSVQAHEFYNAYESFSDLDQGSVIRLIGQTQDDRRQIVDFQSLKKEWSKVEDHFSGTSFLTVFQEYQKLKEQTRYRFQNYNDRLFLTYEGSIQYILTKAEHQVIFELFFEEDVITEGLLMEFQGDTLMNRRGAAADEHRHGELMEELINDC